VSLLETLPKYVRLLLQLSAFVLLWGIAWFERTEEGILDMVPRILLGRVNREFWVWRVTWSFEEFWETCPRSWWENAEVRCSWRFQARWPDVKLGHSATEDFCVRVRRSTWSTFPTSMPKFTFVVRRQHRGASEPSHAGVDVNLNPGTATMCVDLMWVFGVVFCLIFTVLDYTLTKRLPRYLTSTEVCLSFGRKSWLWKSSKVMA
jgi:hypothetical protein